MVYTNVGLWLESPYCITFTASILGRVSRAAWSVSLFVCLSNKLENVHFIIIIMTSVYNYGL